MRDASVSEVWEPPNILVRIFTLGPLRIEVGGRPLEFSGKIQKKPLELLQFLVSMGGESVPVTHFADGLWPEADGDLARQAFDTTLHRLRKLVGRTALTLSNARLSLVSDVCWIDSFEFTEKLELASNAMESEEGEMAWNCIQEALALYRGPFFDGESVLPETLTHREKLESILKKKISQFGTKFLSDAQYDKAVLVFRKGLEVGEPGEWVYRNLMDCYLRMGFRAEGIAIYRLLRAELRNRYGKSPSPESEAIFKALCNGDPLVLIENSKHEERPKDVLGFDLSLPDEPSIAVLPFVCPSCDSEQEQFSYDLSEAIIADLSSLSGLFVTARSSSFSYKGSSVPIQQVGRELGVRYVLEGSVRKADSRLRITVALADSTTGGQIWSRRYIRQAKELYEVQDDVTREIVTALDVKLVSGEVGYWRQELKNPEAQNCYYRGSWLLNQSGKAASIAALPLIERVIELAPKFNRGYAAKAWCRWKIATESRPMNREGLREAATLAREALAYGTSSVAHGLLGHYYLYERNFDQAVAESLKAIDLEPNSAKAYNKAGNILHYCGRIEEAYSLAKRALRLSPIHPPNFLRTLGAVYQVNEQFDKAATVFQLALDKDPEFENIRLRLAATYVRLGQMEKACSEGQKILESSPQFRLSQFPLYKLYKNSLVGNRFYSDLQKAGLPN